VLPRYRTFMTSSPRLPPRSPRLVLTAFSLIVACAPKGSTHRRVVTGSLPAEAATAPSPKSVTPHAWSSGARHQVVRDPSGSPSVVWRVDLGTPLVHDLVVRGSQLYTAGGGEVFCVRADGSTCWTADLEAVGGLAARGSGLAVPTERETLIDVAFDGAVQETLSTTGIIADSPVVLSGELVWVTSTGQVGSETGWTVAASDSAVGRPAANERHLFFGTETGDIIAVNRAQTQWRAVLPGPVVGGVVATNARVFAAYRGEKGRPGGVTALAADSGELLWRMPLSETPAAAPALGEYLVVADRSGEIFAFETETGDLAWTAEVAGSPVTAPTLGQFGLYIGNADGRLHRFDPDDGGEIWSIQLGATPSTAPILLPQTVVIGTTDGNLIAVGGK